MQKYKGFNFVELMLVMVVLGVIITLTMPLLKNIKDDDDIYRAYMKKANQDITDTISMSLIKNRAFTGFDKLGKISYITGASGYTADSTGIRTAIETAINGTQCTGYSANNSDTSCVDNENKLIFKKGETVIDTLENSTPGILLAGKSVMLFVYEHTDVADDSTENEESFGYIYIDMNGNKSPNELCKDRYKFQLYKDRAVMTDCDLAL